MFRDYRQADWGVFKEVALPVQDILSVRSPRARSET